MALINMTPHPVVIVDEANNVIKTIPNSGLIRLKASTVTTGQVVDNVPITTTNFGSPEGLPELKEEVIWASCGCGRDYPEGKDTNGYPVTFCGNCGRDVDFQKEISVYYIVSQLVKSALPQRRDLLVPAEVVRDNNGNIIGCKSLGI